MLDWIAFFCLIGACGLLVVLSAIDLKIRLLPNELVAGFATLGVVFHLTSLTRFVPLPSIVIGGLAGFLALYLIRMIANKLYDADTLGLGDVKLMGAAGLWLGIDGVLLAMAAGASAALLHGLIYGLWLSKKTGLKPDFSRLQIPAGPGFAIGIIAVGVWQFSAVIPL